MKAERWSCGSQTRDNAHGSARTRRLASDRHSSLRERRPAASDRRPRRDLQSPRPVQTYRVRLGQLDQWNAARGDAGEVEAVQWPALTANTMTPNVPAP